MSAQVVRKSVNPPRPTGKLMRLRCRLRPLFEGYFINEQVADRDSDVVFECRGGSAKGHKVILSVVSKFFADLFKDQKPGKVSVVIVPDIPVAVMRLIVKLCYSESIKLNMTAMKDIGNYLPLFGLSWDQFNFTGETSEDSTRQSLPAATTTQSTQNISVQPRQSLPAQLKSQGMVSQQQKILYRSPTGKLIQASVVSKDGSGQPTFVLETNSSSTTGGDETSFRLQKSVPRPILPKPAGFQGQKVVRVRPPMLQQQRVHSNGTAGVVDDGPSIELDMGHDSESGPTISSPEAQQSISQWIASVGRDSNTPPKSVAKSQSPLKRRLSPIAAKQASKKLSSYQCTVCKSPFSDRAKWKWHEDRHVGINLFKCTLCEHIFSTSRQVYQHEMMEHGLVGTEDNQSDDDHEQVFEEEESESDMETGAPLLGHLPVGEEQNRVTVVKTLYGSHYRRLPSKSALTKKMVKKYKQPSHSKLHHNFASQSRNKTIGIGAHEGEHLIELKKLKQLHWLYVCSKCDNCADSSSKAIAHHKACYGNDGPKFEDTVTKYRQGFYGRCKCPLCPRRYTSLGGFLIHCGHMHQDYRKTFSHINSEDVLMCVNCRDKYDDPEAFHGHLGSDFTCHRPSRDDEPLDPDGSEGRQRPYARLIGSNPRSARLQNRLAAVTACFEDDPFDSETFSPVSCPICGESEIQIAQHLSAAHADLDITVERTSESSLRCKTCGITFAVCDLLAHNISCTGSKGLNYIAEKKAAAMSPHKTSTKSIPMEYPPGIGTSPIEKMEREDLLSIDVLREAYTCGVCKKEGKKMGQVSECLRTHGVYRCAICFNSYFNRDLASKHLKKCHSTNSGKAICPICRLVRSNAGQLAKHLFAQHWQPVLLEHQVDLKANKLMNQMQQESAGASSQDESQADVSTDLNTTEEDNDIDHPSLLVAAVLNEDQEDTAGSSQEAAAGGT